MLKVALVLDPCWTPSKNVSPLANAKPLRGSVGADCTRPIGARTFVRRRQPRRGAYCFRRGPSGWWQSRVGKRNATQPCAEDPRALCERMKPTIQLATHSGDIDALPDLYAVDGFLMARGAPARGIGATLAPSPDHEITREVRNGSDTPLSLRFLSLTQSPFELTRLTAQEPKHATARWV